MKLSLNSWYFPATIFSRISSINRSIKRMLCTLASSKYLPVKSRFLLLLIIRKTAGVARFSAISLRRFSVNSSPLKLLFPFEKFATYFAISAFKFSLKSASENGSYFAKFLVGICCSSSSRICPYQTWQSHFSSKDPSEFAKNALVILRFPSVV